MTLFFKLHDPRGWRHYVEVVPSVEGSNRSKFDYHLEQSLLLGADIGIIQVQFFTGCIFWGVAFFCVHGLHPQAFDIGANVLHAPGGYSFPKFNWGGKLFCFNVSPELALRNWE